MLIKKFNRIFYRVHVFLQLKFVQLILSSEINEKFLRYYIKTFKPKYLWIPNNKIRLFQKKQRHTFYF